MHSLYGKNLELQSVNDNTNMYNDDNDYFEKNESDEANYYRSDEKCHAFERAN